MERLQTTLKDLRRKYRFVQTQCRGLVEERADILSQLQKQQKEFISLRQRFGMAQKENEDLSKYRVRYLITLTFLYTYDYICIFIICFYVKSLNTLVYSEFVGFAFQVIAFFMHTHCCLYVIY